MSVALLIIGFLALIGGANLLVTGAGAIARRARVSELLIGLTIVAFGTSLPELVVNVTAVWHGQTTLALGNVVGSNVCNVLLILGMAGVLTPLRMTVATIWKEIPLALVAAVAVLVCIADPQLNTSPGVISRSEGLLLVLFFLIFLAYIIQMTLADRSQSAGNAGESQALTAPIPMVLLKVGGGLGLLALGGQWVVISATELARWLTVTEGVIAVTVVAIGTSLPELATSVVAARNGNADLAVGNVVGSNIFNVFWILGVSATIAPLPCEPTAMRDVLVMIAATTALYIVAFTGSPRHAIQQWESACFLLAYCVFLGFAAAG